MCDAMESQRRRRGAHPRKGAMLVLVAVSLVILFVGAAFSMDVAYMFLAREQLHVATDAAAKAAVAGLSQGNTEAAAIQTGINCAKANTVCGQPLTITSTNVVLGGVTYSATGTWAFTPGTVVKTAAQVTATTSNSLFFGRVLGTSVFTPTRTSTAAFLRNKWCFVFDRSGSMEWDMSGVDWSYPPSTKKIKTGDNYPPHPTLSRWAYLCAGANVFLTAAAASPVENKIGMTSFGTTASTDCTYSATYTPIQTALTSYGKTLLYNQSTNLADGLQHAIDLFSSTSDGTPWNKVIIVLSDGQWNQGSDPLSLVPTLVSNGIVVHTVGLLSGGSNTTMEQLAAQTGGQSLMANSGQELVDAFDKLAKTIPVILTQ